MASIDREQLIKNIGSGEISEVLASGVELKSQWSQKCGKDISAIANQYNRAGGWLIIGVDDYGKPLGYDINWLTEAEKLVSNHISQYLEPDWTVAEIFGEKILESHILFIKINAPDNVVYWNGRAYKLVGTTSPEMSPAEVTELTMKLPGSDYSKLEYSGNADNTLIMSFANKLSEIGVLQVDDPSSLTASYILSTLGIEKHKATEILFGNTSLRIVHFDKNGDILDQISKKGAYHILQDSFIEEVQSWTRKKGTVLKAGSISAIEEVPYPVVALREILANAVAHSLYSKNSGDIVIEMYPNRISVLNNCPLESEVFANKWFSKINKSRNKLLMNVLRTAKITDELGSGKNRIFRYMIENGKCEPIVEFVNLGDYGRWGITLYNELENQHIDKLIHRLQGAFPNADEWRVATAFVLWNDKTWSEIKKSLDDHFSRVAETVLKNENRPINIFKDKIFIKRWVKAIFEGQITIKFSTSEENWYREFLNDFAYSIGSDGYITNDDARRLIGLTRERSEITQLSNLFRKWQDQGHVEQSKKRGEWRFLFPPVK